ncbi:MAG: LpxL/LpxP family Kdo(2)-lipid IV(A) lauroyl/palmitoleoyl acyltransferase [Thiohalophilus sp.]|jgi:lipid A biosynthesis lauroyl/palmitoleoyl acyltransferase
MPRNDNPFPYRDFLHPKYWPTWLGIGLWWLIIQLPYPVLVVLGTGIGWIGFALMPGRRRITRTNLRLCFPDLDDKQIRRLMRRNFISSTLALLESGLAWWASDRRMMKLYRIEGLEHLAKAEAQGKGVLLLGGHYTTLEISGRFLAYHMDNLRPTYKRAHNKLFEAVMVYSRRNMTGGLIPSRDMRAILRNLKDKRAVWYAPDQDFGMTSAVFAPFMGVQTATLTLTARIAKSSGAPMLPFYSERLPGTKGYLVRFGPIVEDFPTNDDVHDATVVNQVIEKQVQRTPEQYLWGHRRFKTRPWGEPQLYKPRRGKELRRYSLALLLLALPAVLYTAWTAIRNRDKRYLLERLGLGQGDIRADIYLHAASIGEINAALPLLRLIHEYYPERKVLVSVNTPSGRQTAEKQLGDAVRYSYLPIDWQWAVARHMRRIKPRCVLIMETELWPNLYEYCYHHGIPSVVINGRLSGRSLRAPKLVRRWQGRTIEYAYAILARSTKDAREFQKQGGQQIIEIGNIKYAASTTAKTPAMDLGRPYILAASTRDGEERLLVEAWLKLQSPRPLLVIVPRHIRRRDAILDDLKQFNLQIAVRSHSQPVNEQTDVYLADTFGELGTFIAGAEFVLMGGSFKPFGGQNLLEAARVGKAVIVGPHMENFQAETTDLLAADGAIQASEPQALLPTIRELLDSPQRVAQLGENGRKLIENNRDMAERYLHELERLCPTTFNNQA